MNKNIAINIGKININAIDWYVPDYPPSIPQQGIITSQILSTTPTELQYLEGSVFKKEVNFQRLWTFELGSQEGIKFPIWNIVRFQQRDGQDSQIFNNDTFYRFPVTNAQCIIGTEQYPDNSILLNFDDYIYSQGYGQIKDAFRALTKDDVLEP